MYRIRRILLWLKLSIQFALFGEGGRVVKVVTLLLFLLTLTAKFAGVGENVDINIGSLEHEWLHAYQPFISVISGTCLFLWIVFSSGKAWAKTTPLDLKTSCDKSNTGTFHSYERMDNDGVVGICECRRIAVENRSTTQTIENLSVRLLSVTPSNIPNSRPHLREAHSSPPFKTEFSLNPGDIQYFDLVEKLPKWAFIQVICFSKGDGKEKYPVVEIGNGVRVQVGVFARNRMPSTLDLAVYADPIQNNLQVLPWKEFVRTKTISKARLYWQFYRPRALWSRFTERKNHE